MVTPIWEVALPVVEVESAPSETVEPVAPEQLLEVTPEVPTQNVKVSATVAETDSA